MRELRNLIKQDVNKVLDYKELGRMLHYLDHALEVFPDNEDIEWTTIMNEVIDFQDEDGGFGLLNGPIGDSDANFELRCMPTYICTAILMKAYVAFNGKLDERTQDAFEKAKAVSVDMGMHGVGYDFYEGCIKVFKKFIRGGVRHYLDMRRYVNDSEFDNVIRYIIEEITRASEGQGNVQSWGYNIKDNSLEAISLFKEFDIFKSKKPSSEKYVWYVSYGSNMLFDRFRYYIEGGLCPYNGKNYMPCKDSSLPIRSMTIEIPYDMYYANYGIGSWKNSAVSFLDVSKPGKSVGRAYLIKESQLSEIHQKEGNSESWYPDTVEFDSIEGIRAYTFTNKSIRERVGFDKVSAAYYRTLVMGLCEMGIELKNVL